MIEEMEKVRILIAKSCVNKFLEKIAELSILDLKEIEERELKEKREIEEREELLSFSNTLEQFIEEKEKGTSALEFVKIAKEKLKELKSLEKKKKEVERKIRELSKIQQLNLSEKEKEQISFFELKIFKGLLSSHLKFQQDLKGKIAWKKIGEEKEVYFLYIFPKPIVNEIINKIKENKLSEVEFPEFSPKKIFQELKEELKKINIEIENIISFLKKNSPPKKEWEKFKKEIVWENQALSILLRAPATEKFLIFEGWIVKENFKILKKLEKEFEFIFIEKIPFDLKEAPIKLKNRFAKIFEPLTRLYGLPKATEPDPTPFLAPFFVLFFGFALSDVGYGLILILLSILLWFKMKTPISLLLLILGIFTIFFGILFGTFFGKNLAFLLDPQKEPLKILNLCFAMGLVHISTGFLIRFFHQIKHKKNLILALAEDFSFVPILLLLAIFLIPLPKKIFSQKILLKCFFLLLSLKFLFHCLAFKNPLKGILKFLGSLWNVSSLLSDTLSYSRLYALGLATGVIASTINLIGLILKRMINIPILSMAIFLFVLIVGHLFNIIINLIGAFVHSARLQFVEFFSKFMEGGGRAFQPFQKI